jgi:hypothetical protein
VTDVPRVVSVFCHILNSIFLRITTFCRSQYRFSRLDFKYPSRVSSKLESVWGGEARGFERLMYLGAKITSAQTFQRPGLDFSGALFLLGE